MFSGDKKITVGNGWLGRIRTILILICFLLQPAGSLASTAETGNNKKVLTLQAYVALACKNDTAFQEILIDELYLNYYKDLTLPAGDIVLSVAGQYDYIFHPDEDNGKSGVVSLSKLFPYTGTTVYAGYSSSSSFHDRYKSSSYNISISQPIAGNAFGRANRLLDKIRGVEIDLIKYQVAEAYEDYLAAVMSLYFRWYSAYENVKTGEHSYNFNKQLLKNIRQRKEFDIARKVDVNKIHLQVIEKEENLITLKNNYDQAYNLILQSIRRDKTVDHIPEFPLFYEKTNISFSDEYQKYQAVSRTYRMLSLLEKKGVLEVDRAADDLLPSANLIVGYIEEGEDYDLKNEEKRAYAGFTFDFPFPGQQENAQHETVKIDLEKTRLTSANKKIQMATDLENLYLQIEKQTHLVKIAQKKINVSEAIVEDELKNYSHGRIALNDLIEAVNTLEENRFTLISRKITLNNLMLEWLRLTDKLISRKEIHELTDKKIN